MRAFLVFLAVGILLVGLQPLPVAAEEVEEADAKPPWFLEMMDPAAALAKLTATVRELPRNQQRAARLRMAVEYLDAWMAAAREPAHHELAPLVSLNQIAQRYEVALDMILPQVGDDGLELVERARAAALAASMLRSYRIAEMLGEEPVAAGIASLEAFLPRLEGDETASARGSVHSALAAHAGRQDDLDGQIRHLMLGAEAVPSTAGSAARTILRSLQGQAHDFEGYARVRKRADEILPRLRELGAAHLAEAKEAGSEGDPKIKRAEAVVKLLGTVDRPLRMLGEKAPEWTIEHAYGDVKSIADLEGKVVVLDFWATWCPWCIKSFPAIRDLLRDYADEDLAVVGVTASANSVYAHRYDLDEDLKDEVVEGQRPVAVARLARDGQRKEGPPPVLPEAEYRKIEHDTLARFIENHRMTWPVVMIDKEEPGPKFALTGWPHAVVLDRQGRIRYFKSGALLRDRPEAVAAFRKVLDDLLAEAE